MLTRFIRNVSSQFRLTIDIVFLTLTIQQITMFEFEFRIFLCSYVFTI